MLNGLQLRASTSWRIERKNGVLEKKFVKLLMTNVTPLQVYGVFSLWTFAVA